MSAANRPELAAQAARLKELIDAPEPLVLANVWDAGSARVVAQAGFPAIATSSAGVAWSMGYPDGENISRGEMLSAVARIAATVDLPVTADLEAGYGAAPEAVAETVREALRAGAVGANVEDSVAGTAELLEFELSVDRIRAGRAAAEEAGVPFVINARTDGFHGGVDDPFAETVRRANAYLEAGAGCAFVPFVRDAATIARLVDAIDGPVNILAGALSPTLPELREMGVARVSIGGLFSLMAYSRVREACRELADAGGYGWAKDLILHPEMNALMS